MNRKEFVDLLSTALAGRVPTGYMREKIEYYRSYISEEAKSTGQDEEDVIEALGTPESIARTIVDSYEREHGPYTVGDETDERTVEEEGENARGGFFHILEGKGCLLWLMVAVVLVIALSSWLVRLLASYPWLVIVIAVILYVGAKRNGGSPQ